MTASDIGRKLVDHDGINNPEATNQRRLKMEAILAGERAFTHKLMLVALGGVGYDHADSPRRDHRGANPGE